MKKYCVYKVHYGDFFYYGMTNNFLVRKKQHEEKLKRMYYEGLHTDDALFKLFESINQKMKRYKYSYGYLLEHIQITEIAYFDNSETAKSLEDFLIKETININIQKRSLYRKK